MRDRLLSGVRELLNGQVKTLSADIDAILEDPTGLTSPTALILTKLEEVSKYQALMEALSGFEDE